MPTISDIKEKFEIQGPRRLVREAIEFAMLRSPISTTTSKRLYWKIAPTYYRKRWFLSNLNRFNAPLNPFKILWVPPDDITRFSPRPYPQDHNAQSLIGSVKSGNWDRPREVKTREDYNGTPAYLYHADRFENTIIHQSLKERFIDGEDWRDTPIYSEAIDLIETGAYLWRDCESSSEILDRCHEIEELYKQIRYEGYQTQFQLLQRGEIRHAGFLEALANEILVDIDRNGEFLFANGRHRLSISKILGLDSIPVVVLVRHKAWMEKREDVYYDRISIDHPDMQTLGN